MATEATIFKPKVLGGVAHRGARRRKKRPRTIKPPLTIKQILAWADAHHKRTGKWPSQTSGRVHEEPAESWVAVNAALNFGYRGLPGGTTLPGLLVQQRKIRSTCALPRLTIKQVLAWADAYHRRSGQWPTTRSGAIEGSSGETWMNISTSLHDGQRGLPVGSSLARLLAKYRHVRNQRALPSLSIEQILKWADAEHQRTGRWPKNVPGPVMDAPGETWPGIHAALYVGGRGLPGGLTLNELLIKYCGKPRKRLRRPPLTIEQILAWADEHHRRTGQWPTSVSGPVVDAPGENWRAINAALHSGDRGLPAGLSVRKLLIKYRGVRPP